MVNSDPGSAYSPHTKAYENDRKGIQTQICWCVMNFMDLSLLLTSFDTSIVCIPVGQNKHLLDSEWISIPRLS